MPAVLLRDLAAAVASSGAEFFGLRASDNSSGFAMSHVTRRGDLSPELEAFLGRAVRISDANALFSYLVKLNELAGRGYGGRFGLRTSPVLVWCKECPSSSFIVPDFKPAETFRAHLESLIEHTKGGKRKNAFILGLCMTLVFVHPFVDANGRTMRLFLLKLITELKRVPTRIAIDYAAAIGQSRGAFALSLYDARKNGDFSSYFRHFY